jgi:hypothetical protein
VAKNCVQKTATCASSALSIAAASADDNARDGTSKVATVCGTAPGLSACPAPASGLAACLGTPPASPYVEVRTATRRANGATVLPAAFAPAISGNDGFGGAEVAACSRATYASAGYAITKAIMVSKCEWQKVTTTNGGVYPPPGMQSGVTIKDTVFYRHGSKAVAGCTGSPGNNVAGGFDWSPHDSSTCHSHVTAGNSIVAKDPASAESGCKSGITASRTMKLVLLFGIYDTVSYNSSTRAYTYHMVGLTGFVITGFKMGSYSTPSILNNQNYCTLSTDRCIYGYFTSAVTTDRASSVGQNFGTSVISAAG